MPKLRCNVHPQQPLERLHYLLMINDRDRKHTQELAQQLKISLTQLKQYFHVMVQKGLLTKDEVEHDFRYQITPHGEAFLKSYNRLKKLLKAS